MLGLLSDGASIPQMVRLMPLRDEDMGVQLAYWAAAGPLWRKRRPDILAWPFLRVVQWADLASRVYYKSEPNPRAGVVGKAWDFVMNHDDLRSELAGAVDQVKIKIGTKILLDMAEQQA